MTEETTQQDASAPAEQGMPISVEQICAAIINTLTSVSVPLENLVANYGGKSIAVNQDPDTKAVTFTLIDQEIQVETESEPVN